MLRNSFLRMSHRTENILTWCQVCSHFTRKQALAILVMELVSAWSEMESVFEVPLETTIPVSWTLRIGCTDENADLSVSALTDG